MAMAIFGIGIMFGPIIGPLLGGWITDNWSWHWIFFINIPIGIVSILMVMLFIVDPPYMKRMKMRIDYRGLALLAAGLGCLQIVLDKGQTEDWFSSSFITWMTVISVLSLALFIINEIFAEHPIVNLRTFRNVSFSTGNLVMFFAFFNLFGSIVLLPIYLQTLMGYTATLAGMVLGPGGIATLLAMPIAGRLVTRVNAKALLVFGIVVSAYSTWLMSRFNLQADFNTIIWPRIVLGVGMGFLFIPLTTLTMSGIRKEEMGNATAIYNLLRNLGGSFGVAFVTTMLARGAQYHQTYLTANLSPFDRTYQISRQALEQVMTLKGVGTPAQGAADASIYGQLIRQATMMSYNDAFYLLSICMIAILPLVFLMRQGKVEGAPGMH
jgi:DHA2 family multidrug resistance protein